jgi:hypothetical protein
MSSDLLERMQQNLVNDWRISDVEFLCGPAPDHSFWQAVSCRRAPSSGSRNIDHSGASTDQTDLYSKIGALY